MTDDIQKNNTTPPITSTPIINLDEEIKQFEQGYQKESTEESPNKISRLENFKKVVETTIQKEKEEIEKELIELKNIKIRVEDNINKMNELKEVDKEIDEGIKSVGQIDEKIKILEDKLTGFKLNA